MAEKLIKLLASKPELLQGLNVNISKLFKLSDHLIANGVEIPVRCKDCKHYEIHRPKVLENCELNGYLIPMKPDDFCSYGERITE